MISSFLEKLPVIEPVSDEWREKAKQRILTLTMPEWALGRLLDLAVDLAGIRRSLNPETKEKRIFLFAGDHGVTAEGVSPSPQEVTGQMVRNIVSGGAAVSVLAKTNNVKLTVIDSGIAADISDLTSSGLVLGRSAGRGTANMAKGPAMTREQAEKCILNGIQAAFDFKADIYGTGEMGIGNTTPSSAIIALYSGMAENPLPLVGRGAGIPASHVAKKAEIIRKSIMLNCPDISDPADVLSKIGGFEIGGIAGLIIGAAMQKRPAVIDGFISTAAAVIAAKLFPNAAQYMIFAHASAEPGHAAMLKMLGGKKPLLDFSMRLGEGSGAALAMPILDSAAAILTQMATFESANVTAN